MDAPVSGGKSSLTVYLILDTSLCLQSQPPICTLVGTCCFSLLYVQYWVFCSIILKKCMLFQEYFQSIGICVRPGETELSFRKLYFYAGNHIASVSICFCQGKTVWLPLSSSATFSLIKNERISLSRKNRAFLWFDNS